MSIGLKGTLETIIRFPPIILTPMFSIWTIGPRSVIASTKSGCLRFCTCYCTCYCTCCCNSPQKLGVSTCLTWINLLVTLSSEIVFSIWLFPQQQRFDNFIIVIFLLAFCPCLVIAMIFLILLQCLDKCKGCCCPCLPCCESNCYPVTQLTYLDVNDMDAIITQEDIELDQF